MKKRWMTSVIEASKQDVPTLPFSRAARIVRRKKMMVSPLRKLA